MADCSDMLVPDITTTNNSAYLAYNFLNTVTKDNYEAKRKQAAMSTAGNYMSMFSGDFGASYDEFSTNRDRLFVLKSVNLTKTESEAVQVQSVPASARQDFVKCMLQQTAVGLQILLQDETADTAFALIHYAAPPESPAVKWKTTITGGIAGESSGSLLPNGRHALLIKREIGKDIAVIVNGGGTSAEAMSIFPPKVSAPSLQVSQNISDMVMTPGQTLKLTITKTPADGSAPMYQQTDTTWEHPPTLADGTVYANLGGVITPDLKDTSLTKWDFLLQLSPNAGSGYYFTISANGIILKGKVN